jgi:hypothetical protein
MKQGPHSLQPTRALHRTGIIRGRLLAWIGDQVRLKAFTGQPRALYTGGGTASCYSRNNRKRGNNKKGTIRLETIVV